jgi:hypothetical protein
MLVLTITQITGLKNKQACKQNVEHILFMFIRAMFPLQAHGQMAMSFQCYVRWV